MSKFGFFLIIFCCFSLGSPAWADNDELHKAVNEQLRKAVVVGDVEDVRAALERGADPNYVRDDEQSPLSMAVWSKNVAILQMLLQHGGNPNHFNIYGTPLLISATRGDGSEKIKVLLRYGANIEITDKSKRHTPLTAAATFGTPSTIKTLLENGADPNNVPENGSSALFMLSINKQCDVSCIELLLRYGADPDLPVGKTRLTYRQRVERNRDQALIELINRYFPTEQK
jgi:ankyrin repeat protein